MIRNTWVQTCEYLLELNADNIHIDFLKELAKHEINPGGPYRAIHTNKVISEDNLSIFLLLRTYNISLTPLNEYILEHFPKVKQEEVVVKDEDNSYVIKIKKLFEKDISKLPSPIKQYWLKLKDNSFTNEVIYLPTYFKDIPLKDQKKLSIINIYGWLYFSLLDQLVDEKEFPKKLRVVKDYILVNYMNMLRELNGDYDMKIILDAISINIKELENGVFEESVIIRSKPYYGSLYAYWKGKKKSVFKQLDIYLLAKQYNDDMHDFLDDMDEGRSTLVTNQIDSSKDIHEQYIDVVLPKTMLKVKKLLDMFKLKDFPFAIKLEKGIKEYEMVKDQYSSLVHT